VTICRKCKWRYLSGNIFGPTVDMCCRIKRMNPVTGFTVDSFCDSINTDGCCFYYERRIPWYKKIFQFRG